MINIKHKLLRGKTFIDLFAGLGGFRLALQSLGAKCIWSDEWNKKVAKVYQKNFHDKPHGDITKISTKDIPKSDIICAGFPCQAFSISGKQLGFKDTRGTLFFDVARITKANQPKVVFMENVKNLVFHDKGKTFKVIRNTMQELGYDFYYKIMNAQNYGVPQNRQRVYMVCFRKNLGIKHFQFPEPIPLHKHVKDILQTNGKIPKQLFIHRDDVQMKKRINHEIMNKPIRIGQVNKGGQGERIYNINGTAITLSANGGGVFAKTGGYLINHQLRRLTPRECARLMGFPDTYQLDKNINHAYTQLGNSVVVNVLQLIAIQIGKYLQK